MMTLPDLIKIADKLRSLGRDLRDESFTDKSRVHNWRKYVSDDVKEAWSQLSDEARGMAFLMAEQQADAEEWD